MGTLCAGGMGLDINAAWRQVNNIESAHPTPLLEVCHAGVHLITRVSKPTLVVTKIIGLLSTMMLWACCHVNPLMAQNRYTHVFQQQLLDCPHCSERGTTAIPCQIIQSYLAISKMVSQSW